MIDELLQEFVAAGKARMAQAFRSFLIDIGNKAIAIGWATHNPAAVTEAVKVTVKRARLTLDVFMAIYDKAAGLDPYAQRAMELAMVTAQRREDIALWERGDVRENGLWVEQGKSENTEARGVGAQTRLMIPLDLRLQITTPGGRMIDWNLKEVISRCWSDRVASRYLIHHSKPRTKSKPGDPVWKDTISKSFAKARDLTDLEWEGKAPPTFHEIRSLAIRIWKEQRGKDFAQALAGHKQASTTDVYADERGNWVMLKSA
jgi:integrase